MLEHMQCPGSGGPPLSDRSERGFFLPWRPCSGHLKGSGDKYTSCFIEGQAQIYGVILVRVELPPHSDRPGAQAPPSASAPALFRMCRHAEQTPLFCLVVTAGDTMLDRQVVENSSGSCALFSQTCPGNRRWPPADSLALRGVEQASF